MISQDSSFIYFIMDIVIYRLIREKIHQSEIQEKKKLKLNDVKLPGVYPQVNLSIAKVEVMTQ